MLVKDEFDLYPQIKIDFDRTQDVIGYKELVKLVEEAYPYYIRFIVHNDTVAAAQLRRILLKIMNKCKEERNSILSIKQYRFEHGFIKDGSSLPNSLSNTKSNKVNS